jgi:DNA-binding response OmpR family regulator
MKAATRLALLFCADEEVHDLANSWLRLAGIQVLSAPTAQDAADRLLNERFDLLVLDELPIHSPGLPSLLELKEEMSHLRIILIPRFGQSPEAGIARISGVDSILVRPLSKAKFLSVVRAFG